MKIVGNLAALSHLLALPYHTCIALRQRALFDGFRLPTLPRGRLAAPCTPEMLVALQGLNIGLSMETLTARAAQFATHLTAASENRANRTTRASTPPTPATSPSNDEAQPAPCDTAAPRLEAPATPRARMAPRPRRARDNDVTAADRLPRTGIRVLPHLADTLTRFQIRRIHREAQQAARAGRRG